MNDFDETLPGPFEWDVKRLVASFAVAGRDRGFDTQAAARRSTSRSSAAYREAMAGYAAMRNLDIWYDRIDLEQLMASFRAHGQRRAGEAHGQERGQGADEGQPAAFNKLTEIVDGEPRIVNNPPLIVTIDELSGDRAPAAREAIQQLIRNYRRSLAGDRRKLIERFRVVDLARKVVGVGSVGTRAWIVLMLGRDGDDPLFLQAKEAEPSVLEPFVGKSEFANHGQRVVEGQRLMQSASDIFLGWIHTDEGLDGQPRDFYLRQLWDAKGSADRRADGAERDGVVRPALRHDARQGPRPLGRPDRDLELPRHERRLRPRDGGVRRDVRRPERARLRHAQEGCRVGRRQGRDRPLISEITTAVAAAEASASAAASVGAALRLRTAVTTSAPATR